MMIRSLHAFVVCAALIISIRTTALAIEPPLEFGVPAGPLKLTTLSGELMWALHRETILAGLVDIGSERLDPVRVEEGARVAGTNGLTRALFVARVANRLLGMSPRECSSLLHGAVAQVDLRGLEGALAPRMPPVPIVLSGGGAMFECYQYLLERRAWVGEVHVIDEPLGAIGARALYEAGIRAGEKRRSLRA